MSEMEIRNGYEFNAERALREEIMSKFFMMGSNSPAVETGRQRFLSAIFGGRSFRG